MPEPRRSALHVVARPAGGMDLAVAVDAFLSQPDLAATTRAKYRQTLTVVEAELGASAVTGAAITGVVAPRWHHASPATWNRHVATVRSFARYCQRTGLLEIDGEITLDRRAEKHDHTRSIPVASLERLWERRDIALRERTSWRLLYETAARADEVLRLNVEDLAIARPHALEGRQHRLVVLRVGERAASPTADRRPPHRASVPVQPAPEPGTRSRDGRSMPGHRPRPALVLLAQVAGRELRADDGEHDVRSPAAPVAWKRDRAACLLGAHRRARAPDPLVLCDGRALGGLEGVLASREVDVAELGMPGDHRERRRREVREGLVRAAAARPEVQRAGLVPALAAPAAGIVGCWLVHGSVMARATAWCGTRRAATAEPRRGL